MLSLKNINQMGKLTTSEKTALQNRFNPAAKKVIESEKVLEKNLVKWVKEAKGKCIKLSSQFNSGLPDRMIMLPKGHIFYCELKSTGKKPTTIQKIIHEEFRSLGFNVYVVDSTEQVKNMLRAELLENEKL